MKVGKKEQPSLEAFLSPKDDATAKKHQALLDSVKAKARASIVLALVWVSSHFSQSRAGLSLVFVLVDAVKRASYWDKSSGASNSSSDYFPA